MADSVTEQDSMLSTLLRLLGAGEARRAGTQLNSRGRQLDKLIDDSTGTPYDDNGGVNTDATVGPQSSLVAPLTVAAAPDPKLLGTGAARKAGEALKGRKKRLDDLIDDQTSSIGSQSNLARIGVTRSSIFDNIV